MDIQKWITKVAKTAVTFNGLCLGLFEWYLYHCHSRFTLAFVALYYNYDKVIIEVHIALSFVSSCAYWRHAVCECVCLIALRLWLFVGVQLYKGFWKHPFSIFCHPLTVLKLLILAAIKPHNSVPLISARSLDTMKSQGNIRSVLWWK